MNVNKSISKISKYCQAPVLGLGVDFGFAWENNNNNNDKLGQSWAKLSCQLGFGCTVINICCLILINMK